MKKIPCLFQRDFSGLNKRAATSLLRDVTPGCEWVLAGEGTASRMHDGTACAVINGDLYKRFDVKRDKAVPPGAIPCQDPDKITGHWPHWIRVDEKNPQDRWHSEAWFGHNMIPDGTYELIGPNVNGNPEGVSEHVLLPYGCVPLNPPRDFDGLQAYLEEHVMEGIIFTHDDGRMCRIRRHDFGFAWPVKGGV